MKCYYALMIGVFDSGYGGLSVLSGLVSAFPNHSFIYLGDNARAPYGIRSKEIVTRYSTEAVDWLIQRGATTVVLACNTASAEALPSLRSTFRDVPILGVIEPIVRFVEESTSHNEAIAVIGTPATIRSGAYKKMLKESGFTRVLERATPLLVPLVETGTVSGPMAEAIVSDALSPLTREGVSSVILGCTHYFYLRLTIEKMYPHLSLFDASVAFPPYFHEFLISSGAENKKETPSVSFSPRTKQKALRVS